MAGGNVSGARPARSRRSVVAWTRVATQQGSALIAVMLVSSLLLVLGGMLVLSSVTEIEIAANVRDAAEAFYAADAGLERAVADLAALADWDAVLSGAVRSSFVDGAPGVRPIAGGRVIDISALTNELRCGAPAPCDDAAMNAMTAGRPWGRNNPRWQPFAHARAASLAFDGVGGAAYLAVWIGDDPAENDGDPLRDGAPPARVDASNLENHGANTVIMVAMAFGPGGARRMLEATISRTGVPAPGVRVVAWRERRE
jgi:hypothetical protein